MHARVQCNYQLNTNEITNPSGIIFIILTFSYYICHKDRHVQKYHKNIFSISANTVMILPDMTQS